MTHAISRCLIHRPGRTDSDAFFAADAEILIDDRSSITLLRDGIDRAIPYGRTTMVLRTSGCVHLDGHGLSLLRRNMKWQIQRTAAGIPGREHDYSRGCRDPR